MSDGYWTYQIVKYKDGSGFGLHEVYYNGDEAPWGRSDNPEVLRHYGPDIDGDPVIAEGLKQSMALMLSDAIRHDVLEEPKEWADPPWHGETDDFLHDAQREEEPDDER